MGRTNPNPTEDSCSSSMDSSSNHRHYHHPPTNSDLLSGASSSSPMLCGHGADHRASVVTVKTDLSTDLRLGLSVSPPSNYDNNPPSSAHHSIQSQREQTGVEWPPIRPLLRSTLRGKAENISGRASSSSSSLFVKVNMEGIPIGRKLDLLAHDNYNELVSTLRDMFRTTISCPDADVVHSEERYCNNNHVLTYEDKEGDWMMVGDVPWEMFLSTVKRLKITRSDKC